MLFQYIYVLGYIFTLVPENLLAFCSKPTFGRGIFSGMSSSSTQQLHIKPPEHRSMGRPPPRTQLMLRPHSNFAPLYLHVCGITETDSMHKLISIYVDCIARLLIDYKNRKNSLLKYLKI